MRIGIPKEVQVGETRVALIPSLIQLLKKTAAAQAGSAAK
jgi:alanine dehydrogenase